MAHWLLVHPPLLGPAVLPPLADELRRRGPTVVLGFSGAGVTLPAVSAAVGARRVVWVDALMPATSGATEADDDIRARLAGLVRNGRIADSTTWWGPGALAELVSDAALSKATEADGHELPADFYDVAVPVPESWPEDGACNIQLSPAYDDEAVEARRRGWPVIGEPAGAHLDVANHPAWIADLLG